MRNQKNIANMVIKENIKTITEIPVFGNNCLVISPHPSIVNIYNNVNALTPMFLK